MFPVAKANGPARYGPRVPGSARWPTATLTSSWTWRTSRTR